MESRRAGRQGSGHGTPGNASAASAASTSAASSGNSTSTSGDTAKQAPANRRAITFKTNFKNVILDVLLAQGWEQVTEDSDFMFHWAEVGWVKEVMDTLWLPPSVRINHYRNHYELTRKDLIVKNMNRAIRAIEREKGKAAGAAFAYMPRTFQLPGEYRMFVEEYKRQGGPSTTWIMKPAGSAQGKGIFLFQKLSEIAEWSADTRFDAPAEPAAGGVSADAVSLATAAAAAAGALTGLAAGAGATATTNVLKADAYIVQRYIDRPYLIGGKKFDMRLYVLVTSFRPLQYWMYREGFARFSGAVFSMNSIDPMIHLTNVAIQKTREGYDQSKGCKWLFHQLKRYLVAKHGLQPVTTMLAAIDRVILHSLQAVQSVMVTDKRAFEMYGYDVLLDDTLEPWIIEVNASPSISADTPDDYKLKFGLLEDMLGVVDLEGRRSGLETRVGGFDLVWNDGPVMMPAKGPFPPVRNSHLGGDLSDRQSNLELVLNSNGGTGAAKPAA